MNPFLIWGVVAAIFIIGLYTLLFVYHNKKGPALSHIMEIAVSMVGASGGVKIFCFVFVSDKFQKIVKIPDAGLVEDDALYFFLGSLALIWVSLSSIIGRLTAVKVTP